MDLSSILARLAKISTTANQICNISGVPGASVGILHHGEVIYTDNFGYRNIETNSVPTEDTLYGIGSLTKSFVAAGLTSMLGSKDGTSIDLETPVQELFPDLHLQDPRISSLVTISDFLSHQSGLTSDMSTSLQGDLEILIDPKDLISAVNDLEVPSAFRRDWVYNNWGYSIAGAIMESITQKPFYQALKDSVLEPLGLKKHYNASKDADLAIAYSALSDGTFHPHRYKSAFEDSVFESAGGIYSTVNELLSYAKSVLISEKNPGPGPLQHTPLLLTNRIPLDNPSQDYRFYGLGWVCTQLPGIFGRQGENAGLFELSELPVLGVGSTPQMVYYHQGAGIGYFSILLLFPETQSAIVVLTNAIAFCDAPDWISQAYTAALFDFPSPADYPSLAQEGRRRKLAQYEEMLANLNSQRNPGLPPSQPLDRYVGLYYNKARSFFIQVRLQSHDKLSIAFQGKESQIYDLRHLHDDVFEWALSYDNMARRERFAISEPDYFLIEFQDHQNGSPKSLTWARISEVRPTGMVLYEDTVDSNTANGEGSPEQERLEL
ncbi:hypothetical protein N7528_003961 [Penicillium herquei]|nr:hypothetical protein N7528_003961 [Penicillium herquei]